VIGEADELIPDLIIACDRAPAEAADGARTIVLRSDPDGEDGTSIYRYDRAGLLMALKSAAAATEKVAGSQTKKRAGRGK
jgi:two-component system chemotaxis sensor kinase CheA